MDSRITSLGLLLEGVSFISPLGLAIAGIAWYSSESLSVQGFLISTGLILTIIGLIKRGSMRVSSSEVLMLASGFLVFLALYEFAATAMASTPFGDRCAEAGDPIFCSIISNVKLFELMFWPAILTPALTFVGAILALRWKKL
jgi:uncharacterized membrane protein YozB (DUF420 family)